MWPPKSFHTFLVNSQPNVEDCSTFQVIFRFDTFRVLIDDVVGNNETEPVPVCLSVLKASKIFGRIPDRYPDRNLLQWGEFQLLISLRVPLSRTSFSIQEYRSGFIFSCYLGFKAFTVSFDISMIIHFSPFPATRIYLLIFQSIFYDMDKLFPLKT